MTPERAADLAARKGLSLSEPELVGVAAIISKTGDLAPESEVVREFLDGGLTTGMLTFFLPWMWRYRQGDSPVPTDVWRALFAHAEYTEDMVVTRRPTRTVRAYRGATRANQEGLSWSLDVGQAEYFARDRQAPGVATASVWVTNIPAERVFARYVDGWEKEVTADVRGLAIHPLEEAHLLPKPHAWWQLWR